MPYKNREKAREYARAAMERKRKGITEKDKVIPNEKENVIPELTSAGTYFKNGVEMVPPAYVPGIEKEYEFLPERPRFLTLSDGQVLDRAKQPEVKGAKVGMKEANDAYFGHSGSEVKPDTLEKLRKMVDNN